MHKISTAAFALALSVAGSNAAKADQPGADWMPLQQVVEQVFKSGYTQLSKVEAENGQWEGEGIKNGQKMEFKADPKTGVIISEKQEK
jgi:Peptidase propeptide and YPEB domain